MQIMSFIGPLCNKLSGICLPYSGKSVFNFWGEVNRISSPIISCACVRLQACIVTQYYKIIHSKCLYKSTMKYT